LRSAGAHLLCECLGEVAVLRPAEVSELDQLSFPEELRR
jgi:hypothetical protein